MGSPAKVVGSATKNFVNSLNDYGTGAHQVLTGDLANGASNLFAGTVGTISGGLSQNIMPGQSKINDDTAAATSDAQNVSQGDAAKAANAAAADKLDKINTTIDQNAKLRLQMPGRSQTILTQTLNKPKNPGTILTS